MVFCLQRRFHHNLPIFMKKLLFAMSAALALAIPQFAFAGQSTNSISTDLMPIIGQIQNKLKAGQNTEADLADNLKAMDAEIASHQNGDKEELGEVYLMKAQVYSQVLDEDDKATEVLNTVKKNFAGTDAAQNADKFLAQIKDEEANKAISRGLAVGTKFPGFDEKDLAGNPLSPAGCKCKVLLLDFWATWCPPCRAELPNVIALYKKYHPQGFEVIGISLDSNRGKLDDFIKSAGMDWPQYYDGLAWDNKLAKKYGVDSIPMTYLLDGNGTILGKDLRGEALESAVSKALAGR
jgi:thiol-disulfide isomerase/thioredoxin